MSPVSSVVCLNHSSKTCFGEDLRERVLDETRLHVFLASYSKAYAGKSVYSSPIPKNTNYI